MDLDYIKLLSLHIKVILEKIKDTDMDSKISK